VSISGSTLLFVVGGAGANIGVVGENMSSFLS
jgi:hypothetical protein